MMDDYGHPIFEVRLRCPWCLQATTDTVLCCVKSIKITLVCDDCLQTDHPEKCALASNLVHPLLMYTCPAKIFNAVVRSDTIGVVYCTLQWVSWWIEKQRCDQPVYGPSLTNYLDDAVSSASRITFRHNLLRPRLAHFVESLHSPLVGYTQRVVVRCHLPHLARQVALVGIVVTNGATIEGLAFPCRMCTRCTVRSQTVGSLCHAGVPLFFLSVLNYDCPGRALHLLASALVGLLFTPGGPPEICRAIVVWILVDVVDRCVLLRKWWRQKRPGHQNVYHQMLGICHNASVS